MVLDTDEWIYSRDETSLQIQELFKQLTSCKSAEERLEIVQTVAATCTQKNRFFIDISKKPLLKRIKLR